MLIKYLRAYRCLVILDDVQMIFSSGEFAGHYQRGYEEYGEFFRRLGEFSHHSCLLLLSWEPPANICQLEAENAPVRCLSLNGLETSASSGNIRRKRVIK